MTINLLSFLFGVINVVDYFYVCIRIQNTNFIYSRKSNKFNISYV